MTESELYLQQMKEIFGQYFVQEAECDENGFDKY